ncbi:MAG TPA: hypothetical protein PLZ05_02715 [Alphaproteobacteria bacterium]|nr:hypothetical protein [Alphaproteobacteria bacterium]
MITEIACWYEYIHNNSNFLLVKVANFNTETNVLNIHHNQSFLMKEILPFDNRVLMIGEKANNNNAYFNITRGKFLYFMYDSKTGIFSSDFSDVKDDQTIKRISGILEKSIKETEVEISENLVTGSFIRNVDLSDKSTPKLIEPCRYHTIINNYDSNGKDGKTHTKAFQALNHCSKINSSIQR